MQEILYTKHTSNEEWIKQRQQNLKSSKESYELKKQTKKDTSFRNYQSSYNYQDNDFFFDFIRIFTFF